MMRNIARQVCEQLVNRKCLYCIALKHVCTSKTGHCMCTVHLMHVNCLQDKWAGSTWCLTRSQAVTEAAQPVLPGRPDPLAIRAHAESLDRAGAVVSLATPVYRDRRASEVRSSSQVCLFKGVFFFFFLPDYDPLNWMSPLWDNYLHEVFPRFVVFGASHWKATNRFCSCKVRLVQIHDSWEDDESHPDISVLLNRYLSILFLNELTEYFVDFTSNKTVELSLRAPSLKHCTINEPVGMPNNILHLLAAKAWFQNIYNNKSHSICICWR